MKYRDAEHARYAADQAAGRAKGTLRHYFSHALQFSFTADHASELDGLVDDLVEAAAATVAVELLPPPAAPVETAPPSSGRERKPSPELVRRVEVLLRHLHQAGPASRADLKHELSARLGSRRAVDSAIEYVVRHELAELRKGDKEPRFTYKLTDKGAQRAAALIAGRVS